MNGHRLDGWLLVSAKDIETILYQVEVKSWSIHGLVERKNYKLLCQFPPYVPPPSCGQSTPPVFA
jgi:hypothetical protein